MTAFNDRFWAKVLFKNFIKHYRKLSNDERLADIEASMDALEDLDDSGSSFGAKMVKWSMERADEPSAIASRENGKKGGRPRKNITAGAPNGDAGDESATACGNNKGRSPAVEGSARFPGSAGERPKNLGSGKPVSTTTISTSGPRQAENEEAEATSPSIGGSDATSYAHEALDSLDKASDQAASNTGNAQPVACRESGKFKRKYGEGNTANVQPSGGPEDGKFEVTTKKPNGVCADAGNGNAPEDCKSATSAQPLRPWKEVVEKSLGMTGNRQRRAGGISPLSVSTSSPSARSVDVLNLAYSGEFGNVKLTQEQYAELGIRFGNQQKLNRAIDSLSCKIENEEINPRNHYAELLKWASYRDDMEEKEELKASSAPHYETVSEHNRRVLENGRKWIDEHYPKKESANG